MLKYISQVYRCVTWKRQSPQPQLPLSAVLSQHQPRNQRGHLYWSSERWSSLLRQTWRTTLVESEPKRQITSRRPLPEMFSDNYRESVRLVLFMVGRILFFVCSVDSSSYEGVKDERWVCQYAWSKLISEIIILPLGRRTLCTVPHVLIIIVQFVLFPRC